MRRGAGLRLDGGVAPGFGGGTGVAREDVAPEDGEVNLHRHRAGDDRGVYSGIDVAGPSLGNGTFTLWPLAFGFDHDRVTHAAIRTEPAWSRSLAPVANAAIIPQQKKPDRDNDPPPPDFFGSLLDRVAASRCQTLGWIRPVKPPVAMAARNRFPSDRKQRHSP